MRHKMGVPLDNITVFDRSGVLHAGRTGLAPEQMIFATAPAGLTLEQALKGADMFLGLSGPGALPAESVREMAETPIIFALANPTPEIMPDAARTAAPGTPRPQSLGSRDGPCHSRLHGHVGHHYERHGHAGRAGKA